jgi:hypothetical protein
MCACIMRLIVQYTKFASNYRRLAAILTKPTDRQALELFGWDGTRSPIIAKRCSVASSPTNRSIEVQLRSCDLNRCRSRHDLAGRADRGFLTPHAGTWPYQVPPRGVLMPRALRVSAI